MSNTARHPLCHMRTSLGNCIPIGGFCTDVNEFVCEGLHNAYFLKVSRPQGKWKVLGGTNWHGISYCAKCSNCKACYDGIILSDYSFCPNCGARMKGADDE